MDLDHVNHSSVGRAAHRLRLFHYTNMENALVHHDHGVSPIWNEAWQDKVQLTIHDHGKHPPSRRW